MACKLDRHPNRDALDRAIISGTPFSALRTAFDATNGTLSRHRNVCIREMLNAAIESRPAERAELGSNLLTRVEELIATTKEILTTAKTKEDLKSATNAVGALTRLLELLGKLDGSLVQSGAPGLHLTLNKTINVYDSGSDKEIAELVREATADFNPVVIERFKQLAACTDAAAPIVMR
jgi:hypothetical protein